jgi:hypothetical protein
VNDRGVRGGGGKGNKMIGNINMVVDRPIDCREVIKEIEKLIKESLVKNGTIPEHGNVVVMNWQRYEESDSEGSQGSRMGSQGSQNSESEEQA